MDNIITVEHISKKFGEFEAIKDVSFSLEGGKIYGIIGPNGAGKSTMMSLLMGLLLPTSGSGNIKGFALGSNEAKAIMGYSPEFPNFYSDMNCLEYLVYMGQLSGLSWQEAIDKSMELIKEFDLEEHTTKKVASFSTGMKKKVGLMQALMHDPEILLLDEPTANLDPTSRSEIIQSLKRFVTQRKMTVLISSHVLSELETIIDHVVMINSGRVVFNQSIEVTQQEFNQEKIVVSCKQEEIFKDFLDKNKLSYTLEKHMFRITTTDKVKCKKDIIEFFYKQDIEIDLMKEEYITLEGLYQQIVEEEQQNENHG